MPNSYTQRDWPEAFRCLRADPRFSYCRHIPATAIPDRPLFVVIHGSGRNAMAKRNSFALHPDTRDFHILAPLFPVSPLGDGNGDGYKYLAKDDLRYDEILLEMIDKYEAALERRFDRLDLFGFSGGGHFVHRFSYRHAKRLSGVTIRAPGLITLPTQKLDWPLGLRGLAERIGQDADL